MKIPLLAIIVFISLSCNNSAQDKTTVESTPRIETSATSIATPASDNADWKDSFLALKKAIIAGDKKTVKTFIDFPIKNEGNEIWFLVDQELFIQMNPKEIKAFTEADFEKYFSSVFGMDLRETLEKLNTEELFETNKSTSPEIEVVKDSKSKLEASHDAKTHKITLALVTTLPGNENSKFTIDYNFEVVNGKTIKFRQVHVQY